MSTLNEVNEDVINDDEECPEVQQMGFMTSRPQQNEQGAFKTIDTTPD